MNELTLRVSKFTQKSFIRPVLYHHIECLCSSYSVSIFAPIKNMKYAPEIGILNFTVNSYKLATE